MFRNLFFVLFLICIFSCGSLFGATEKELSDFKISKNGFYKFARFSSENVDGVKVKKDKAKENALDFLAKNQKLFCKENKKVKFKDLKVKTKKYKKTDLERTFVRCQQFYNGLAVYNGQVIVQVGQSGNVEAVISDIMQDSSNLDLNPDALSAVLSLVEAEAIAVKFVEDKYELSGLTATESQLLIFAPSVVGLDGNNELAWKFIIVKDDAGLEKVLVGAISGEVLYNHPLQHQDIYREVYIFNTGSSPVHYDGDSFCDYRIEYSDSNVDAEVVWDVNRAFEYAGDAYEFFESYHERDGIDDEGMTINMTVDKFILEDSGWAEWEPLTQSMSFARGMVVDDVVAHEYVHGITNNESNLDYSGESGAINESFSDVWAEWIDQLYNHDSKDTDESDDPSVKWQLGEDSIRGVKWSIKDPTSYSPYGYPMPDRYFHPNFNSVPTIVHHRGTVGSKLAYLLTDGDTFNGYTINAMGIETVSDLLYECQCNLLPSSADYFDYGYALNQAAINLGFTSSQRDNVANACYAVEIVTNVFNETTNTPYPTISSAVSAAVNGDVIVVEPGTYYESVYIGSKAITLKSVDPDDAAVVGSTVLDGSNSTMRGIIMTGSATVSGFTIKNYSNNSTLPPWGGGVMFDGGSGCVEKCVIINNQHQNWGGGICVSNASPTISNCTISNNTSDYGGGICVYDASPTISNCTISNNTSDYGGGIRISGTCSVLIQNCLLCGNSANQGGAIYNGSNSSSVLEVYTSTIVNNSAPVADGIYMGVGHRNAFAYSILWNDSFQFDYSTNPYVNYSRVPASYVSYGNGNISSNPMLNPVYRLSSGSPCRDATNITVTNSQFNSQTDIDGDARIKNYYLDMGADEY